MSEHTEQVRSLWIPLRQVNMLLPHTVVAEIGNYRVPDGREDTPEWILGDISWRGITIPVVSLETLCGETAPASPPRHRCRECRGARGAAADPALA